MFEVRIQTWDRKTYSYTADSEEALERIIRREKNRREVAAIFAAKKGKRCKQVYKATKKKRK